MANRARTEAYTLIELMIVVVIIGVVVGLAGPRLNDQIVERRKGEALLGVVRHFREVRSAAVGSGRAHRVVYNGAGSGTLTFERAGTSRCATAAAATANGVAPTQFVENVGKRYSPSEHESGSHPFKLTLLNPPLASVELCFQPTGVMYWRADANGRFSDNMITTEGTVQGGFVFRVGELDNGRAATEVMRRVVLPFGGDARVLR